MTILKKGELSQLLVGSTKGETVISSALDDLFKNAPPQVPVKVVASKPEPKASGSADTDKAAEKISKLKIGSKRARNGKDEPEQEETEVETADREEREAKAKRARRVGHGLDKDLEDEEEEEAQVKKPKKNLLGRMPQDSVTLKRTIFIGNITIECITDGKVYSQLKALCVKYGKIKAIRFRSIAFSEILPRKVAFIQGKFHSARQSCNAYVEYTSEESATKALELNGTVFQEKHLRIDLASNAKAHDSKRSIFVGNLDFAAQEEELWTHFGTCGTVENVRIIRDARTNIGKGFGYVQFDDRAAVALALKLNGTEINSRKLRVERGSDKVSKEKKGGRREHSADESVTSVLEGTRSVKGDKPSNKKRRTARSQGFAEKKINFAKAPESSGRRSSDTGGRGGFRGGSRGGARGGSRGGRGGSRGGSRGSSSGGRGGSRGGRGGSHGGRS
ncbi:hypothetical protein BX661DRAFT_184351 [Kickxella alabastrina]|uniref:uncharacterized protein n=1 Tax=Kickxella alabastrina TaxID=61397 RepID=UPI00221E9B39|nr:uncharacterized protein BX661DRAFT_184351 [Kickxella alabastrina]KAI7825888.1 hypothetical protein BX661DRAFT_184351 [Kickxella alabastrina]KAJ1947260.1 Nucleolar protein 12 [Kickxella alabastrina]